jgi:hypothetical protein
MSWETDLDKVCRDYKIEPMLEGPDFLLVVPKMPSQEVQDKLKSIIPPEIKYRYVEGPRLVTTISLRTLFQQIPGISATVEIKDKEHEMIFKIDGDAGAFSEEDSQALAFMKSILNADTFVENWKIIVNGTTIYDSKISKMLAMQVRPERDACPTLDEIMDLRITLENCQTIDEFINSL